MRHLDLFSGIGGFSLAADWVWGEEHEIVAFVEIDPFCQKVLKKHWPEARIHGDIRTFENTIGSGRAHGKNLGRCLTRWEVEDLGKRSEVGGDAPDHDRIGGDAHDTERAGRQGCSGGPEALEGSNGAEDGLPVETGGPDRDSSSGRLQGGEESGDGKHWEGDWETPWLEVATALCRVDDGVPRRMDRSDRLKALGNAIVPQVLVPIYEAIKAHEGH